MTFLQLSSAFLVFELQKQLELSEIHVFRLELLCTLQDLMDKMH